MYYFIINGVIINTGAISKVMILLYCVDLAIPGQVLKAFAKTVISNS